MTDYSIFPKINATLNGCSAVLLVIGHRLIMRGKMAAHRAVMIAAFATSCLFLISYLYYTGLITAEWFTFAGPDGRGGFTLRF